MLVIGNGKIVTRDSGNPFIENGAVAIEGKIIKVDRRKKRAKVVLDLYDEAFSIDLAFEVIEKAKNTA